MVVWILLPAYNEEKSLTKILPKIKKEFEEKKQIYRIVVVDVDKYSRLSKSNNIRLYPTMLITRDGKVLGRVDGASVNDILTKLSRLK